MTSILFVDDDPLILAGLRRMLRAHRKEWEFAFVTSGPDALAWLERATVDIVISDMRMPGMDGAELLACARQQAPATVRLVLSGQASPSRAMRAVGSVHQFLAKPCDAERLVQTISRIAAARAGLPSDLLEAIGRLDCLPVSENTWSDVRQALAAGPAAFERLTRLFDDDVALATKVIQLSSSAFFGIPQPVNCAAEAAALLGAGVLTQAIRENGLLPSVPAVLPWDLKAFNQRSRHMAEQAAAAARAEGAEPTRVRQCATAALLHDLGQLVIAAAFPERYARMQAAAANNATPLSIAEQQEFGADRPAVANYLLQIWGAPEFLHCNSLPDSVAGPPSENSEADCTGELAQQVLATTSSAGPQQPTA